MLSWKETWIVSYLELIVRLVFIFVIGTSFGPLYTHELTRAFDGSLASAFTPVDVEE
jgi:hypothetical protein